MDYFLPEKVLRELLGALCSTYDVFVPTRHDGHRIYQPYLSSTSNIVLGEVRTADPLKAFYFRPRERVANEFESAAPSSHEKPPCALGVKACDLKGFAVLDHVFSGDDFQDPFFTRARTQGMVISSDCTCALETCFCMAMGLQPYPEEGYDINFSPVEGGFVVDPKSEKGLSFVMEHGSLFASVSPEALAQRDENRSRITEQVERNIAAAGVPRQERLDGAIQRHYDDAVWADEAATCVECGACNTVCPTCHCFFLYDQEQEDHVARFRAWDSCLIKDFARVAGGANPRPHLWMRLRNRFEKKFDFFPKTAGLYACTGCGRCIAACPARIDIRRILKKVASNG